MTIGSTTSVSSSSASLGLDPEGRLALLVLEHQETQEEAARASKAIARDRFTEASAAEVEAMRDKADDILRGAIVQGLLSVAASGLRVYDSVEPCRNRLVEGLAAGASETAPVFGKYFGDSPAATEDANARRASLLAEQARWQLEDAKEVIDKASKSRDKAIDWVTSVNANQASAETGIIAGLA